MKKNKEGVYKTLEPFSGEKILKSCWDTLILFIWIIYLILIVRCKTDYKSDVIENFVKINI